MAYDLHPSRLAPESRAHDVAPFFCWFCHPILRGWYSLPAAMMERCRGSGFLASTRTRVRSSVPSLMASLSTRSRPLMLSGT
ncbi:hypothetical protein PM082_020428 [Marasmius tenuissimus]|nr:hypothetical protein PM082_020428 [Marasmius tenuissimus]